MTEVPDYLLERSKAHRAKLTGEGGDAGGSTDSAPSESAAAPAVQAHQLPLF